MDELKNLLNKFNPFSRLVDFFLNRARLLENTLKEKYSTVLRVGLLFASFLLLLGFYSLQRFENNIDIEAESQISPISGSIKKQIVNFISEENIKLYGKNFDSKHYKILSKDQDLPDDKKLNFDVWLDKKTGLILKVKYSKMGDWEYRLKSFN